MQKSCQLLYCLSISCWKKTKAGDAQFQSWGLSLEKKTLKSHQIIHLSLKIHLIHKSWRSTHFHVCNGTTLSHLIKSIFLFITKSWIIKMAPSKTSAQTATKPNIKSLDFKYKRIYLCTQKYRAKILKIVSLGTHWHFSPWQNPTQIN